MIWDLLFPRLHADVGLASAAVLNDTSAFCRPCDRVRLGGEGLEEPCTSDCGLLGTLVWALQNDRAHDRRNCCRVWREDSRGKLTPELTRLHRMTHCVDALLFLVRRS